METLAPWPFAAPFRTGWVLHLLYGYICTYIHTYVYIYIYVKGSLRSRFATRSGKERVGMLTKLKPEMHEQMDMHIYISINIYIYTCIHIYICICIYAYMYMYMYIYIYIYVYLFVYRGTEIQRCVQLCLLRHPEDTQKLHSDCDQFGSACSIYIYVNISSSVYQGR